jgi:hypothetical protein
MIEQPFAQYSLSASYACCCFSSSYSVTASYCPDYLKPKPYVEPKDKGVKEFFESLGYKVGQDGKRFGPSWWEIFKDGCLVCQVDQYVPLQDIIDDMSEMALGKPGVSKTDYTISGEDCDDLTDLFHKVRNFKLNGVLPTDHLIYEI